MRHGHSTHPRVTFRVYETNSYVQTFYARAMSEQAVDALIGNLPLLTRDDGGFDVVMRPGRMSRILTFYPETIPAPAPPTLWKRVRALFK